MHHLALAALLLTTAAEAGTFEVPAAPPPLPSHDLVTFTLLQQDLDQLLQTMPFDPFGGPYNAPLVSCMEYPEESEPSWRQVGCGDSEAWAWRVDLDHCPLGWGGDVSGTLWYTLDSLAELSPQAAYDPNEMWEVLQLAADRMAAGEETARFHLDLDDGTHACGRYTGDPIDNRFRVKGRFPQVDGTTWRMVWRGQSGLFADAAGPFVVLSTHTSARIQSQSTTRLVTFETREAAREPWDAYPYSGRLVLHSEQGKSALRFLDDTPETGRARHIDFDGQRSPLWLPQP